VGYQTDFDIRYGTRRDRHREIAEPFDKEFEAALVAVVERTPGLTVRTDVGICQALMWADDPLGCYWVGCGISDYSHAGWPDSIWPTFLWLSYVSDGEGPDPFGGKRPLDLGRFCDTSSRDAEMLAELVVAAAAVARRRRNDFVRESQDA
jgi:hypothetical protein